MKTINSMDYNNPSVFIFFTNKLLHVLYKNVKTIILKKY